MLIVTLLSANGFAQDSTYSQLHQKYFKNIPFSHGEELTFKIRYGFIKAGSAKMRVFEEVYDSTHNVYHFQTTARSASGFSWIYEVKDVVNSYVQKDGFYPLYFEKKLREGSYYADLFTHYLPQDSVAKVHTVRYRDDMTIKKQSKYDVTVLPYTQDILSSFYFIRLGNLEVGKSILLRNHEKKKIYNLEVIVHRKEVVEVGAGTFRCIVVEPLIKGEGLFKNEGRLRIWLTDDDKKIPVQMKSKVLVGDITTELMKIKGVKGKIAAQIK